MFSSKKWEDSKLARTPTGKRVLRRADGDSPSMGWIYGDMLKAKEDIKIALNHNESRYLPIWKLIERRTDMNWWKFNGNDAPDLRDMAVRVLGLTTSSSGCERNWSVFELIHTKKRNRLDHKRLNDLVFVKFNATIKTRSMEAKRDPIAAKNFDDGKVTEWLVGFSSSNKTIDDEEDEVFPGEGLTWQQVADCMDADTEPRKSYRQSSTLTNTKSSKKRGKRTLERVDEEEEPEFSASSEEELIEDDISEGDYETDGTSCSERIADD